MKKILFLSCLAALASTSCVSKKTFLASESARIEAQNKNESLSRELGLSKSSVDRLSKLMTQLAADTTELGKQVRSYQAMLSKNMSQQEKLDAMLQLKRSELDEREATINELQSMINAQNDRVMSLLQNVQDALLGFSNEELTVTQHNGKVYVAMSDKLLFQSGSARLDKRGIEALAKLAQVLNTQTDIDVYIEGHTDSKPINTVQFKDNWDLSVIRATSVVRILTKDYGVNPLQIVPSGRGEFSPVADNETADGRAKNRRTEIIMAPKLDKLFEILQ
ncbi:MAG: OmpA family protein [Bacteroidales bacterium]